MIPSRIFDLYYGQPASGKSQAARDMIKAVHAETGKKARVIIGDGSTATYERLQRQGLVEICEFAHRPWPPYVVQRLMEGWFPIDGPLGPLVPPDKQPTFPDIGMYVIEGASVMGSYLMSTIKGGLAWQSGQGVKIGQDSPFQLFMGEMDAKGKLIDGPGENFGGNPMSHYGVSQRHVMDAVTRSKGLAPYVIWTAHEVNNDPDKSVINKELIVGPEVVGKALTANFQRMFGNTLHFQTVAKRGKIKDEFTGRDVGDLDLDYRIWTRDHFSPDNNTTIRYKAVTRDADNLPHYFDSITKYYDAVLQGGLDETPSSVVS
jgi:hypothetical protein